MKFNKICTLAVIVCLVTTSASLAIEDVKPPIKNNKLTRIDLKNEKSKISK